MHTALTLGVAREPHARAGHRDERAVVLAEPEVRAELDRPLGERSRLRALDERQHLGDVGRAEPSTEAARARHRSPNRALAIICEPGSAEAFGPARRPARLAPDHDGGAPGPDELAQRVPGRRRRLVGDGREHGDLGIVAEGEPVAFRYRGLRAGQRVPDGVVEHVHVRASVVTADDARRWSSTTTLRTPRPHRRRRLHDRRGRDRARPRRPSCATRSGGSRASSTSQPQGTAAEGHATLRMYNLLAKDPVFQAMPVHPSVLPIVERLLDRGLPALGDDRDRHRTRRGRRSRCTATTS